jgi:biotin carboxyl carrier protein
VVELEVAAGDARLYIRQRPGVVPTLVTATPVAARAETAPSVEAEIEEGLVTVVTPLGGVLYASPSPDAPPYVVEGDIVEPGQVVALVEAMKVFNEIHVETAGTVVQLLAKAGQVVQAGQALMAIRPDAGNAPAE